MGEYQKASKTTNFIDRSKPPLIQDVLFGVLSKYLKKKPIPECMPAKPYDAVHWFIAHQEQPHEYRDLPQPIEKDGDIKGWITPYHDRLKYNLRVFLSMSEPQRTYIAKNIENGIPWRGDSILMYAKIIEHHGEMLKDKDAFISNAKKVARSYQTN